MFQFRSSAAIQYSRVGPALTSAARSELTGCPFSSASSTRGGTSTSPARALTSILPWSAGIRWPARVQKKVRPLRPRKLRRSIGSRLMRRPYFLTTTVSFISVGWIVQMNL